MGESIEREHWSGAARKIRGWAATSPHLFHNFLSLSVIQIANYLLPLITMPYNVRVVGIYNYGILAIASSLTNYFVVVTEYGFKISATREVSIHRHDRRRLSVLFASILILKVCLCVLSYLVLLLILGVSDQLRSHWDIQLLSAGLVIANVFTLTWFFQGMERMKYITFFSLLAKIAYTIGLFVFVHTPADFYRIPLLGSSTEILAGLAGVVFAMREFGIRPALPSFRDLWAQLSWGWHAFISTVAVSAYSATPTFAVGMFTGAEAAGYYSVAERLAQVYQMFPLASLLQTLYPRFSSMYAKGEEGLHKLVEKFQSYTTWAYVISLPLFMLAAPLGIRIVTGGWSPVAILILRMLAVSVLIINANAFRLQYLLVAGRHREFSQMQVVTGTVGAGLVFLSAYLWSYAGPPVSLAVIACTLFIWTKRSIRHIPAAASSVAAGDGKRG